MRCCLASRRLLLDRAVQLVKESATRRDSDLQSLSGFLVRFPRLARGFFLCTFRHSVSILELMGHPLDGVRAKIERAKEHFQVLQPEVSAFLKLNPYSIVDEHNPYSRHHILRAKVHLDTPPRLGIIAGDIFHNLRSALDHLVWQLVLLNSNTPDDKTAFPIFWEDSKWNPPKRYESSGRRKIQGVAPSVEAIIERLQPYHRTPFSEHPLFILHTLNIRDKHKLLNFIGLAVQSRTVMLGEGTLDFMVTPRLPRTTFHRLAHDAILLQFAGDMDMEIKFTYYIAFDEPEIVQRQPVIPTLQSLIDFVEKDVVLLFDPLFT